MLDWLIKKKSTTSRHLNFSASHPLRFLAILDLSSGESLADLALPPFNPPLLPIFRMT
jgi:hypothetical protein